MYSLHDDNDKTFIAATDRHVGSSGFSNFSGSTPDAIRATLARVFTRHPGAVVVDGNDDWGAPVTTRPRAFASHNNIEPLAVFHTGISGISPSGVVLDRASYKRFMAALDAQDPKARDRLKVYEAPKAKRSSKRSGRAS